MITLPMIDRDRNTTLIKEVRPIQHGNLEVPSGDFRVNDFLEFGTTSVSVKYHGQLFVSRDVIIREDKLTQRKGSRWSAFLTPKPTPQFFGDVVKCGGIISGMV